jgi:hypothetical protein
MNVSREPAEAGVAVSPSRRSTDPLASTHPVHDGNPHPDVDSQGRPREPEPCNHRVLAASPHVRATLRLAWRVPVLPRRARYLVRQLAALGRSSRTARSLPERRVCPAPGSDPGGGLGVPSRTPNAVLGLFLYRRLPTNIGGTMKKLVAVSFAVFALSSAVASANPSPPTNGGNGAGQSGQCTGAAADRPTSCQSPTK